MILSIDIFYFKTVIIGGPTIQSNNLLRVQNIPILHENECIYQSINVCEDLVKPWSVFRKIYTNLLTILSDDMIHQSAYQINPPIKMYDSDLT